jgi:ATP-dependent DNA helicase RecG
VLRLFWQFAEKNMPLWLKSGMTIKEIKRLRETEDKVEFKEAKRDFNFAGGSHADPRDRRKCVLGYVVALANEGGGYLVFGVKEKSPNEVVGTAFAEGKIGELADDIYKRLSIRVEIEELFESDKRVLVFKIPSRLIGSPLHFEGVPLMRIGDSLRAMSNDEFFRILSERAPDFSATVCEGLTFEDLDPEAIALMKAGYAKKQKNPAFEILPDLQVLIDLGLLKNGKFNYASLILFGKRDALREYLPNAEVIIEYRLDHSMISYTARKEFQESLFTVMDKIWAYVNQPASNPLLHVRHKFTIYDIPAFNEDVIREAVLNAIGHRLWRDLSSVVIKQYPDSINIINSGGLYYEITKQPAYMKEYRLRDLQIVAGCFEKKKEVFMRDFVEVFHNQLSCEQVRHLIAKLETERLLTIIKAQKYTRYTLNYDIMESNNNVYSQFLKKLLE